MNKYLVVYKVIYNNYEEKILNDIFENDKLNEELFEKVYNHHRYEYEVVCILNIIKLDN